MDERTGGRFTSNNKLPGDKFSLSQLITDGNFILLSLMQHFEIFKSCLLQTNQDPCPQIKIVELFETFLDYSSTGFTVSPVAEYADGVPVDISHVSPFQPISTEF